MGAPLRLSPGLGLGLSLSLGLSLALSLGAGPALCQAARSSREPPAVTLPQQGTVLGREVTVQRNLKAISYLGIPFAHTPDRLMAPSQESLPKFEPDPLQSDWPPACPQDEAELRDTHRLFVGNEMLDKLKFKENCLFLNIFVPDGNPPDEGWPVMVWIHPGEFSTGGISLWDGSALAAKQKVIVVTIAYRLGMFGFLNLGEELSPGNYGLLDQVAGLNWTYHYIDKFKGSQKNICLFGYGAGGVSVGLHILSPLSNGMFTRAITMSGNTLVPGIMQTPQSHEDIMHISDKLLCSPGKKNFVQCVRNINPEGLKEGFAHMGIIWGPTVDYYNYKPYNRSKAFLMEDPSMTMEFPKVDLLTGHTVTEEAFMLMQKHDNWEKGLNPAMFESEIADIVEEEIKMYDNESCPLNRDALTEATVFYYRPQPTPDDAALRDIYVNMTTARKFGASSYKQAMSVLEKGGKVFLYRFAFRLKTKLPNGINLPNWANVPHYYDLPFVWGMPYWQSWSTVTWNNADRKLADTMMALWTNFAKSSNPNQGVSSVKWDPINASSPGVMLIDRTFEMSDAMSIDYKEFEFWNSYFPFLRVHTQPCCNMTGDGVQLHYEPVTLGILVLAVGTHALLNMQMIYL